MISRTGSSVTIVGKCKKGHETFMFPEKCVTYLDSDDRGFVAFINWDCPVCPMGTENNEVELDDDCLKPST